MVSFYLLIFLLIWVLFPHFFACLFYLIVNFSLLGAGYFCIPVIFLSFVLGCSYLETFNPFSFAFKVCSGGQEQAESRANYLPLPRQDPSVLYPVSHKSWSYLVQPVGTGTILSPLWVLGTVISSHFRSCFFPRSWVVSSHAWADQNSAEYSREISSDLWSPVSVQQSPLRYSVLWILSAGSSNIQLCSFNSVIYWAQPGSSPYADHELSQGSKLEQLQGSPCSFPVTQGWLSFITWLPMSWKSLFRVFCQYFLLLQQKSSSSSYYSILLRSGNAHQNMTFKCKMIFKYNVFLICFYPSSHS